MREIRSRAVLLASVSLNLFALASWITDAAKAQSINQTVVFGASSVDDGWFRFQPCPAGPLSALCRASIESGGRIPTTPGGPMNSDALAAHFGLKLNPADAPGGGTDFAVAGADNNNRNKDPAAPSTVSQMMSYLGGNGGAANPNALYLISSGGNDIAFAQEQRAAHRFTHSQENAYIVQAAQDLATGIAGLAAAGARYIVVTNTVGAPSHPPDSQLILYTNTLWSTVAAKGVNFIPADTQSMQQVVLRNPAMFGFTSVSQIDGPGGTACINPNPRLISGSWSLYCTPALLRSPNAAQTSYWADDAHLSAGAQQIEADYEYSLIVAPSEISLLAEVPVVTRAAVVSSIFNQIPISQRQRAVGTFGAWVGGDVATLKMSTGSTGLPGDLGNPLSAILGMDYAFAPGWLIGGALSVATTTQNFDLGGNFKQSEFALSFYSGFAQGPIWANFAATYGGLHDNVNRAVPIGITMQSNSGSTSGTDTSLGAELGYNFTTRSALPAPSLVFTHGPLAGIVLQRVHVNGFNETDQFASIGGFTALSFADQTRNSAVSEFGWQARTDLSIWRPFAKLVWNHELASTNRSVTAALTTAAAEGFVSPSYTMPAVVFGKDWATLTIGTTVTLGRGITGSATFSSEVGQSNLTTYGAQVGLNVAFPSR